MTLATSTLTRCNLNLLLLSTTHTDHPQFFNYLYIEDQGEDAACACWIYTKDDVTFCDENGDIVMHETNLSNSVLTSVCGSASVHTTINDCIERCVEEYQKDPQALGF
jgi:hypothetical protein